MSLFLSLLMKSTICHPMTHSLSLLATSDPGYSKVVLAKLLFLEVSLLSVQPHHYLNPKPYFLSLLHYETMIFDTTTNIHFPYAYD